MSKRARLTESEVAARLADIPAWTLVAGRLHRELRFRDFSEAFAFMTRVSLFAEKLDHHPDWANSWNRVTIDLVTHDAGGITELDLRLAAGIDRILEG